MARFASTRSASCATSARARRAARNVRAAAALDAIAHSLARPKPSRCGSAAMKPVGHYAYSIDFSDGHDTGIYTLESLRELGAKRFADAAIASVGLGEIDTSCCGGCLPRRWRWRCSRRSRRLDHRAAAGRLFQPKRQTRPIPGIGIGCCGRWCWWPRTCWASCCSMPAW